MFWGQIIGGLIHCPKGLRIQLQSMETELTSPKQWKNMAREAFFR